MKLISTLLLGLFLLSDFPQRGKLSKEEIDSMVDTHNYWRQEVGVNQKLEWSDDLAVGAAKWAKALQKGCGFEHSQDNPYGENLFKGTTGYFDAKDVVDSWASERRYYDYDNNACEPGEMCGHYTQVIWQTTERVGCAKVTCDGMDIWVCEYDPPGNWVGQKPY